MNYFKMSIENLEKSINGIKDIKLRKEITDKYNSISKDINDYIIISDTYPNFNLLKLKASTPIKEVIEAYKKCKYENDLCYYPKSEENDKIVKEKANAITNSVILFHLLFRSRKEEKNGTIERNKECIFSGNNLIAKGKVMLKVKENIMDSDNGKKINEFCYLEKNDSLQNIKYQEYITKEEQRDINKNSSKSNEIYIKNDNIFKIIDKKESNIKGYSTSENIKVIVNKDRKYKKTIYTTKNKKSIIEVYYGTLQDNEELSLNVKGKLANKKIQIIKI